MSMNTNPIPDKVKNNPGVIQAWSMFDWANSAYNLVITSTIFPAYYTAITTTPEGGDQVQFLGFNFANTALANYSLALAYLIMVLLMPFLSGVADGNGRKKDYMKLFTYLGGIACCGLFFFRLETLEFGIFCSMLAAMGYVGGMVFNNSYLPEIASPDQQNRVSAQGFAYGYVGSVILQAICFLFVLKPEWFGISDASLPARLSFLLVGLWWIGFSQIPFRRLPDGLKNEKSKSGLAELKFVLRELRGHPFMSRFLTAYFFYIMGVQTIMLVAAAFGEKLLHLGAAKLIATILLIQLVAIAGAYLMARLAKRWGDIKILLITVAVWIFICIAAYFLNTEFQFYLMAILVGLIMGGIQSLSRATYSKLIPEGTKETTSFFSFYDVTEKLAIVVGLFSFALVEELSGTIRNAPLILSVYFIIGWILLFRLKTPKADQRETKI